MTQESDRIKERTMFSLLIIPAKGLEASMSVKPNSSTCTKALKVFENVKMSMNC